MSNSKNLSYALVDYYAFKFKETYGRDPIVNKFRDRWGFQDMVESISFEDCKRVIDFYFKTSNAGHKLGTLFTNFDKLLSSLREAEQDKIRRSAIRAKTAKVVEDWENNNER